jgi:hypothetical protein
MRRNACSGRERLSKKSFLSMLNPPLKKRPEPPKTIRDQERQRVLSAIEYCGGKKTTAASMMGITVESLNRKMNITATDQQTANSPSGSFFERMRSKWTITSFDSETFEVCAEVSLPHGKNYLSTKISKII